MLCINDLDFRWNTSDGNERRYTMENIKFLLDKYMYYLDKYLKINDNQRGIYLEKRDCKLTKKPEIMKDGIHIMLPI